MEIVVSPKLNKTVLRRPIYPIKTPVGKEHTANQTNTITGNILANVLFRPKSFFTKLVETPTMSTKPITKKAKKIGTSSFIIPFVFTIST